LARCERSTDQRWERKVIRMPEVIKSYKGFHEDMTCKGFQYEEGKEYITEKAKVCECSFFRRGLSILHRTCSVENICGTIAFFVIICAPAAVEGENYFLAIALIALLGVCDVIISWKGET